jgi:hypothetical protein
MMENRGIVFITKHEINYGEGEWRSLHNEELHSLYHSPNIIRVIKSIRDGLGVTCLPRDPRFAGSGRKNPEHKSSDRDFKLGVPSLRFQAR